MQLYQIDHVFEATPPGYEDTDLVIGLKVVANPELNAHILEQRGLNQEKITEKTLDLICSKVQFVKGYEGIETGRDLYIKGAPEVWDWVQKAVFSSLLLSRAERKNL